MTQGKFWPTATDRLPETGYHKSPSRPLFPTELDIEIMGVGERVMLPHVVRETPEVTEQRLTETFPLYRVARWLGVASVVRPQEVQV